MAKAITKTYFSRSTHLAIGAVKGKQIMNEGQLSRIGEKIIQFSPRGVEDKWGAFSTDDPELIAILESRCDSERDVLRVEEYNRQSTPPEIRVEQLERQLAESNRLLQQYSQADGGKQQVRP